MSEKLTKVPENTNNWIVNTFDDYSDDYKLLRDNWEYLCKKLDTTRKKIVIVTYLPVSTNTEKDKIVATVTNNMIEDGHTIRRVGEFVGCSVCNKAIPTQRMYNLLKLNVEDKNKNRENLLTIPSVWKNHCEKCK